MRSLTLRLTRMSRLLITLMIGLLGAGHVACEARQLKADDPVRIAMVSQARSTPVKGVPSDARLAMNRVWVDGSQAYACGVRADAHGAPVITDGHLQLKRVSFRKQGSRWQVERADQVDVSMHERIDLACSMKRNEPTMLAALRELESNPPAAGTASKRPAAPDTSCDAKPPGGTSKDTGTGRISKPGRSALHSAPSLSCYIGKFIVRGDKVNILARIAGWAQVSYTHPITQVTTVGWLKEDWVKLGPTAP